MPQKQGTGKNPTNPLYSDTRKSDNFLNEQNMKIKKTEVAFKDFGRS